MSIFSFAQPKNQNAVNGLAFTPKGEMHLLFIFIGFNHSVSAHDFGTPGTLGYWAHHDIPNWAKGSYNEIIDADLQHVGDKHNLTNYYNEMSLGQLMVTGEVFPEQIMVNPLFYNGKSGALNYGKMASQAIEHINSHYPDYDWSQFDRRKNYPNYYDDNSDSQPDGVLDHVVWVFRDQHTSGGNSGGFSGELHTTFGGDSSTYTLRHGHQFKGDKNLPSEFRFVNIHEIGHNLFNAPHYGAANQVAGDHFTVYSGSGMMTRNGYYQSTNAWERWYLGWTDITYDLKSVADNGTYSLNDFITTGQSLRIEIPQTNQHLWLEYHGEESVYDKRRAFAKDKNGNPISDAPKGVLVYIEDMAPDRHTVSIFHHGANGQKVMHPGGSYDYSHNGIRSHPDWWVDFMDFQKGKLNPLSGNMVTTWVRGDVDTRKGRKVTDKIPDGSIGYTSDRNYGEYNEQQQVVMLDGQFVYEGMEDITFTDGDCIARDEPTAIVPLLDYDEKAGKVSEIALNALSISFKKIENGYEVTVRFDDVNIAKDTRYCGDIGLYDIPGVKDGVDLKVLPSVTLEIDKSGTPNRHTETSPGSGDFVNPTVFTCKEGTLFLMESHSTVVVKQGSTLRLLAGSTLELQPDATLIIEKEAKLIVEEGAHLILHPNARLKTKKGEMILRKDLETKTD